jgi:carboxymethylenebutenolidase
MKGKKIALMLIGVLLAAAGGWAEEPMSPAERNISYAGPGGVTLEGYLAVPEGRGPFPAVLMIHEWWGLNQDTALLADALSEEGYVVLAADAFRGSVADNAGDAMSQVRQTPQEQIAADLDAALEFLRGHNKVDAQRVAPLGFCFGGTQAMYMGTRRPDLAAVVIFYGGGPITEAERLGSMKQAGPVLGIYGEEDGNIPVDQVRAFERAMDSRGVENTVLVYPGVGHAFVKSGTYDRGGTAEEAWSEMLAFLDRTLNN